MSQVEMNQTDLKFLYLKINRTIPFEYIAATGYLSGNITLILKGIIVDGNYILPAFHDIIRLDPVALQALSGLLFVLVSIVIYGTKKYPRTGIKIAAILYYLAYGSLLLSGYNQDAFIIHALGLLPCFIAATLMLRGNKLDSYNKNIFIKYPIATAGLLFASGLPAVIYSAFLDSDHALILASFIWIVANIAFALTDKNLKQKLFTQLEIEKIKD